MNPRAALLGVLCGGLAVSGVGAQTRDDAPSWTVYGDYRLRGAMDRERRSAPNRERIRMRLRLGADVRLIEGLIVGARLYTTLTKNSPCSQSSTAVSGCNLGSLGANVTFLSPG